MSDQNLRNTESQCTCSGERWPGGKRIVTVGCRVHHVMDDGCLAADHEVTCACGNFKCDHDCTAYERTDEGGYDLQNVCGDCVSYMVESGWTKADG